MMGVKEIISKSFALLKQDIKIWSAFIVCELGVALLGVALRLSNNIFSFFVDKGFSIFVVGTLLLFLFVALSLLGLWINIALIRVIHKRLSGEKNGTLLEELSESRHLVARTFGTVILFNIFVFLPIFVSLVGLSASIFSSLFLGFNFGTTGTIILSCIGLYGLFHAFFFSIEYVFAPCAVILDGQHIRQGFHTSGRLTSGRFFSTLWRFVVPLAVYVVIFFLIGLILTTIADFIPNSGFIWVLWFIGWILSPFFPLLFTTSIILLYNDLKKIAGPAPTLPPKS